MLAFLIHYHKLHLWSSLSHLSRDTHIVSSSIKNIKFLPQYYHRPHFHRFPTFAPIPSQCRTKIVPFKREKHFEIFRVFKKKKKNISFIELPLLYNLPCSPLHLMTSKMICLHHLHHLMMMRNSLVSLVNLPFFFFSFSSLYSYAT